MGVVKLLVGLFLILIFVGLMGYDAYRGITYDIDVGGHLKLAAKANTPDIALGEMNISLKAMEARGYTEGFTSVLYRTPDEDVGYWYRNMKATRDSLAALDKNATQLEESNVLMKLRESIVDDSVSSESLKDPPGIQNYPYNGILALIEFVGFILFIIGIVLIMGWWHDNYY
jgi:preprotein translocase subunit SecF